MSKRLVSRIPLVAVLALVAGILVACQKPLPKITVFGNGKSVVVDAAFYQFTGGPTHGKISDYGQAPLLTVQAGSDLLVDVPRKVAKGSWIVSAFTLDAESTATAVEGIGGPVLHDQHTTRVATAPAKVGTFFLQVVEVVPSGDVLKQIGGWVVQVRTKA